MIFQKPLIALRDEPVFVPVLVTKDLLYQLVLVPFHLLRLFLLFASSGFHCLNLRMLETNDDVLVYVVISFYKFN